MPRSHVYVRHLDAPGAARVRRLDDPVPAHGRTVPGRWWPPLMLEPGWVEAHHRDFDLMHVHFGFDAVEPAVLAELVAALGRHGRPLVYTVHDLVNPHHRKPGLHEQHLDVLVDAADALITLTPGAADEVRRRWGREAVVLPHPHVVPAELLDRPRPPRTARVVGIHAKSARANSDPLGVVRAVVPLLQDDPDLRVRVDAHRELLDPGHDGYAPHVVEALRDATDHPRAALVVHDYFTDDELWAYLSGLDVSVLPYRFGTHSGWLEACHDLGTAVVAPSCGFYAQQRPVHTYRADRAGMDPAGLREAVSSALAAPPVRPGAVSRAEERRRLDAAHLDLYRRLLDRTSTVEVSAAAAGSLR